jgi:Holliday junction resolvase RusA-like endonuclease
MTGCTLRFANVAGRGRIKTRRYRGWSKQAMAEIAIQARGVRFAGTFQIEIAASDQGLVRDRDCDNLGKAIADALTKAGVIEDDGYRFMRAIDIAWAPDLPAGRCVVEIREIAAAPMPKPAKAARRSELATGTAFVAIQAPLNKGLLPEKQNMIPAPRQKRENIHTKPKSAAVPAKILRALRAKGIKVPPERVRLQ